MKSDLSISKEAETDMTRLVSEVLVFAFFAFFVCTCATPGKTTDFMKTSNNRIAIANLR